MKWQNRIMQPSRDENSLWWPVPCRGARRLIAFTIILTSLILLIPAVDLLWKGSHGHEADSSWMNAFSLSAPALWPAGSPLRHPETVHPAIDLRFTAGAEIEP